LARFSASALSISAIVFNAFGYFSKPAPNALAKALP